MILRKVSSFEPNIFIKVILYQDLCHLFLSMALNASSLRMGSFINCSILIFPLLVCGSSAQILVTLGIVLFSFNSFTPRMFGYGDLYLWHLLFSAVHLVLHLQHIVKLFLCQLPLSRMIEPMTKVKKKSAQQQLICKMKPHQTQKRFEYWESCHVFSEPYFYFESHVSARCPLSVF